MIRKRNVFVGFTTLELVVAMGMLSLLFAAFFATLRSVCALEERCALETRAVIVLQNTVERLAADDAPSLSAAQELLADEFGKSDLPRLGGMAAVCRLVEGRAKAEIRRADGRPVAAVEIGP